VFRLLAQLFRKEIRPEMADRLTHSGVLDLLVDEGYQLEPDVLADPGQLATLRAEYMRIFIGPGRHVPPYGSVHHPAECGARKLWGSTTAWVHRFAKDHGVAYEGPSYDGIPDHVGHELELWALLLEAHADALEKGDDERTDRLLNSQRLFHAEQLAQWVPLFCEQVREASSRPFYAEIARVTTDMLAMEAARLTPAEATG